MSLMSCILVVNKMIYIKLIIYILKVNKIFKIVSNINFLCIKNILIINQKFDNKYKKKLKYNFKKEDYSTYKYGE